MNNQGIPPEIQRMLINFLRQMEQAMGQPVGQPLNGNMTVEEAKDQAKPKPQIKPPPPISADESILLHQKLKTIKNIEELWS